jgi:hypothetical protein
MAINVQYGPISTGLGLAAQAGEGERVIRQRQLDMEFQKMVQQQQAQADAKYAAEVRTAIACEQQGAENTMQAQKMQLAAQGQAADQERQAQAAQGLATERAAQTTALTQKGEQNAAQHQAALTYLEGNPDAKARYLATGKLEPLPTPGREESLQLNKDREDRQNTTVAISRLQEAVRGQERVIKSLSGKDILTDAPLPPTDPAKLAQYNSAGKAMAVYQQQLDGLLTKLTPSAVSPAAVKQMVQQGQAPAQAPAQGAPQAAPSGVQTISTAAQFNELAPGATFIWQSDGKQYVKGQ